MRRIPTQPLNVELLREVVQPRYVQWVNHYIRQKGPLWYRYWRAAKRRYLNRSQRTMVISEPQSAAYYAYLTLHPIETLLKKRNQANHSR